MTQVRKEVEVGTLSLSWDKNSVVAENVLSYSSCLSSKLEVQVAHFGTKTISFLLQNADLSKISMSLSFLIKHIYRSPIV